MYRVEQVLVPLDFSSFSRCALTFAKSLGEARHRARALQLHLLHAVTPMPEYMRTVLFPYAGLGEDDRLFEAEIADEVRRRIEEFFQLAEMGQFSIDAEPEVRFDSEGRAIVEYAGTLDIQLIAMGLFGGGGVDCRGMGSTARRVVAAATHPVALLRDFDRRPRIGRILAAVDLSPSSRRVIEVAASVAIDLGAALEIICVVPTTAGDIGAPFFDRETDRDTEKLRASMEPKVRAFIDEELISNLRIPFSSRQDFDETVEAVSVQFGDPSRQICEMAHRGDFDMVVVGKGTAGQTVERSGLGGVTSAVIAGAPAHLLVVPDRRRDTPLERWDGK